jgi:hypothetical protein
MIFCFFVLPMRSSSLFSPRLVADTLKDPREAVRGQAVAVLAVLTHHCFTLAQLAAYGGAFDDLFDMIADCGGVDSGQPLGIGLFAFLYDFVTFILTIAF